MGTVAEAKYPDSIAIGKGVRTTENEQIVLGKYNQGNPLKTFIIGNGTSASPKNALTIDSNSNIEFSGNINNISCTTSGEWTSAFGYGTQALNKNAFAEGR